MKLQKGSWLVLLPLAVLSGYLIYDGIQSGPQPAQSAPTGTNAEATIKIWRAEVESPLGERLAITLAPLHGEHQYAQFDGDQLQARFGLDAGKAWRLELLLPDGAGLEPGYALSITDANGVALRGLESAQAKASEALSDGKPTDPVATVFGTGGPGSRNSGVHLLWGRYPAGDVQLVLSDKALESGKKGSVLASYPLEMERLSCNELPRSFLRLETASLPPRNNSNDGE